MTKSDTVERELRSATAAYQSLPMWMLRLDKKPRSSQLPNTEGKSKRAVQTTKRTNKSK